MSAEPINPELWEYARPAILDLRRMAKEYLEAGGWGLKADLPKVDQVSDTRPWPWLSVDQYSEDRPLDWERLYGVEGGRFTHIPFDSVASLGTFRDYARSLEHLRGKLLMPSDIDLDWVADLNLDHLTLGVFDRSMHLDAGDDDILPIYLEAERAVLAPELSGDLLVPLVMAPFGDVESVSIADGVTIERISDVLQQSRALASHGPGVHVAVLNAATHAVVFHDITVDNTESWRRRLAGTGKSIEAYSGRLDLVLTALRILTPLPMGYAQIMFHPHGWADRWKLDLPPLIGIDETRRYPDVLEDGRWRQQIEPLHQEILDELPSVFQAISAGDNRLAVAARRLDLARRRGEADDVVIDCAVGLEALLGGDRTEMAHRIATRAATLLREKYKVGAIYSAVKGVYNRRSEIVHGSQRSRASMVNLPSGEVAAHRAATFVLAEVIRATIEHSQVLDNNTLDAIALQAIDQMASAEQDAHSDVEKQE